MPDLAFEETAPRIHGGRVRAVEPGSLAADLGLQPGDEILRVNGQPVEDVIDVQFYAAEDEVEIGYLRPSPGHLSPGHPSPGHPVTLSPDHPSPGHPVTPSPDHPSPGHPVTPSPDHPSPLTLTRGPRRIGQPLGLEFTHPTFDIDIRRCNNLCPFCFVLQTAPRMRRTLYIKDDDYRYSFLYGHFVTLTNLSQHDWERLETQRLSPLYISVHSTDLDNRRACLSNPRAPDVLEQIAWLAERRIEMHTQLVITPGLNDGPFLEKSVRDLAAFYPAVQSVCVAPVGLTRHHKYGHRPHTVEEAQATLAQVSAWQAEFRERWGVNFVYLTDEWYLLTGAPIPPLSHYDGLSLEENGQGMVRRFLEDWERVQNEIPSSRSSKTHEAQRRGQIPRFGAGRKTRGRVARRRRPLSSTVHRLPSLSGRAASLVTATLFAPLLRQTAAEFDALAGTQMEVIAVLNERLGHTITVAGLLMGQDVIAQLQGRALGEFVVLPRVMFDHPQGISLDDVSPLDVARALGRPLFLADGLGDVLDAFTGRNPLRIHPDDPAIPPEVMKAGGWAVEKYL